VRDTDVSVSDAMNERATGNRAVCLRCGAEPASPYLPCPVCLEEGVSSNHRAVDVSLDGSVPSGDGVPLTPLRPLSSQPRTLLKDERGGLTWSFKDRLAKAAADHAVHVKAGTIAVCSSGNHGAAVAAAASAHGLRCVVLSMASIPPAMRRLVTGCGGELVPLRTAEERWTVMREAVAEVGWYPASNFHDPPIGSNPFAVAGYRTIAHEIVEQMGVPDWVVVPVAYGDGLSGVTQGFLELAEHHDLPVPRMLAAVTSASLPEALANGHDQPQPREVVARSALSIACPQATYQAVHAVRATRGAAVLVDDRQALAARRELGRTDGIFLELSSAVACAAVNDARRTGLIGERESAVVVGTSPGLKDQPLPDEGDGALQPIGSDLDEVLAYLGREPLLTSGM
jgi:threonine synthase